MDSRNGTNADVIHNAEQVIIGAAMLNPASIPTLQPRDFYAPNHAIIWQTVLNAQNTNNPTDPVAIAHQLGTNLHTIGGAAYLHTCINTVPTTANTSYYTTIIKDAAARRRTTEISTRLIQATTNPDTNLAAATATAITDLTTTTATTNPTRATPVSGLIAPTLDAIEAAGTTDTHRLTTGLLDADMLLGGGISPGLTVIAGRPGMGKSVLALEIVRKNALHTPNPKPILFHALEMSGISLMQRLLAAECGIGLYHLTTGTLTDTDWTTLARKCANVDQAPLHIDDNTDVGILDIRANANTLTRTHGPLDAIIVDYLQLMRTSGRQKEHREREIAELTRGLKILSTEFQCPVIAVSQLNRGPENRLDKTPTIGDLRESGAIEQDADVVILLNRPDYYGDQTRAGEVDVHIAKNRNGPTGKIVAAAQLHYARFVDMAPDDHAVMGNR